MKHLFALLAILGFFSCSQHEKKAFVSELFIDSLIQHYRIPEMTRENRSETAFWKGRINPKSPGYLNESRYAGCLQLEFRFFGDIDNLIRADSVLESVNQNFNYREASVQLSLASNAITGHRFTEAGCFLQKARQTGLRPYESLCASFDVDFELGKYRDARADLAGIQSEGDYGYFYRKSKMNHLDGQMDSSIQSMLRAADLAGQNRYLRGIALANAADLYVHDGKLQEAAELYVRCLSINSADFHSLLGLGWIAMIHDGHDSLASEIFRFVLSENKLPDPLFRLMELAEIKGDQELQQKHALAFVQKATDPRYGRMYSKYLIQIYAGVLHNGALAERIAKDELANRATPQSYAWYAWALLENNKKDEALKIFHHYVSGKPLEGLELYWMGKLMEENHEGYNAFQYYAAARSSQYDLDPLVQKDLETKLHE